MRRVALLILLFVSVIVPAACDRSGSPSERRSTSDQPVAEQQSARPGPTWDNPPGRWNPASGEPITPEMRREFARLRTLSYAAGSKPPPAVAGVTVYDSTRTFEGLNFYTSGHFPGAVLMDMKGNVLHEWRYNFIDAWRESGRRGEPTTALNAAGYWRHARLMDNGDVLAIFEVSGLIKINRDSELQWAYLSNAHHDLDVTEDGRIYTVVREVNIIPRISADRPILEDFFVILDPDGHELKRVPLLEAFENSPFAGYLEGIDKGGDVFHTNTVEVLDGRIADKIPAFKRGNVLTCLRELDVVAVVDLDSEQVDWATKGPWHKPHMPTVLQNGNIMIFDNRGYEGASRIIEFDPVTKEIVWEYHGKEPQDFHSNSCGANQRLPNGNTLITETDRGRAFEVTPDGEIVWEYVNPAYTGPNNEFIASLFEMVRIPPDFPLEWLE
jgi:hypothetical protein